MKRSVNKPAFLAFTTFLAAAIPALSAVAAETPALVVGVSTYVGQPERSGCARTARDVAEALRRRGLSVATSFDGSAASVRNAIEDFTAEVTAAPGTPAVIYVCAAADVIEGRVFLLPGDVELGRPGHAQTAGVSMMASLNALAGANGLFVADLDIRSSADARQVAATLHEGLPAGSALALLQGPENDIGALGRALAGADGDGASTRKTLQSQVAAVTKGKLALYDEAQPAQSPPTPVADGAAVTKPAPDTGAQPMPAGRSPAHGPVRQVDKMRRVQAALATQGKLRGPLDGRADARTVDAIRRYQSSIGDPPTGTLTQTQILTLLNEGKP